MSEVSNNHHEFIDDEGSRFGMWIFIFTEILLFGGLFIVYSVFRSKHPEAFHSGALELNTIIGTIYTIILLISSATVAMSITAVQKGETKLALRFIFTTLIIGLLFLIGKAYEWTHKIHLGIYPSSEHLATQDQGHILFFGLYFGMSGLHALHIIVGMIILSVIYLRIKNGRINSNSYVFLENGGLYWHLVDLIWIFLFPLLYLIT